MAAGQPLAALSLVAGPVTLAVLSSTTPLSTFKSLDVRVAYAARPALLGFTGASLSVNLSPFLVIDIRGTFFVSTVCSALTSPRVRRHDRRHRRDGDQLADHDAAAQSQCV